MRKWTIAVSRQAKGKAGTSRKFNDSFKSETHTLSSLINLAAVQGYSFLAGEYSRGYRRPTNKSPFYKTTYRITENFRGTYIIPLDDDRGVAGVENWWLSDPLFSACGGGLYHSNSSRHGAEKVRPIFELDRPIMQSANYKLARLSLAHYYNKKERVIDPLPQIPQVWYGVDSPTSHVILSNILPLAHLQEFIIKPYQNHLKKQATQKPNYTPTGEDKDVSLAIKAFSRQQNSRHNYLLWLGGFCGQAGLSWGDVSGDVLQASKANGHYDKYAKNDKEVERVFNYAN